MEPSERKAICLLSGDQAMEDSECPPAVMRRGFSVVRDDKGRALRDAKSVKPGASIEATLARGRLVARVERSADEQGEGGRSG